MNFLAVICFVSVVGLGQSVFAQQQVPIDKKKSIAAKTKLAPSKKAINKSAAPPQQKTVVRPPGKPVPPSQQAPVSDSITTDTESSATGTVFESPRMAMKKTGLLKPSKAFFYVSTSYLSFADQIFAKISGQKEKARSVFTGYSLGTDYTRYIGRYLYSWNVSVVSGVVDIQRVLGVTYPRKSFSGGQSGPEIGYRVNSDFDLSWGVNLLYRDIESVGASFALSNQMNIRFRFSPRLTFFQSFGNYGKPTSYSYSIGLRWLL